MVSNYSTIMELSEHRYGAMPRVRDVYKISLPSGCIIPQDPNVVHQALQNDILVGKAYVVAGRVCILWASWHTRLTC